MGYRKDLTGKRFGRLLVLSYAGNSKHDNALWLCKCDCGNETIANSKHLLCGGTTSCGCFRSENKRKTIHKKYENLYENRDTYLIGKTIHGQEFLIDYSDYDLIKDYNWNMNHDGYMVATINSKQVFMARYLLNCPDGLFVDHINGNRSDNRRENLRIVTRSQNHMNRAVGKNNKTGITGVSLLRNGKYKAALQVDGKELSLGCYDTIEEAAEARYKAEDEYFGEYSFRHSRDHSQT